MYILYLLLALLVLLVMVTIHEFGHYIAGKLLKFKINEFSIGFGKSLYSRKSKKTGEIFSVRLIPLGGYCAFEGEEGDSASEGAFSKMAPWKRIIVLLAGPMFNIISAIFFSIILLCATGYDIPKISEINSVPVVTQTVFVEEGTAGNWDNVKGLVSISDSAVGEGTLVEETAPQYLSYDIKQYVTAKNQDPTTATYYVKYFKEDTSTFYTARISVDFNVNSNILIGDVVWKVNGQNVDFVKNNQFATMIQMAEGEKATLTVKRSGEYKDIVVDLYKYGVGKNATNVIGVQSTAYQFTFFESVARCVPFTFGLAYKVLESLWQLITGQLGLDAVGGPLTTITTIATYTQTNIATIFILLPLIAVNLGVFNLLPIPALDGSKIVFVTIEWIRGKPINPKVENMIYNIGFFVLIGLVLIADIYHFIFVR